MVYPCALAITLIPYIKNLQMTIAPTPLGGSLQDIVDLGGCSDEGTLSNIASQALCGLAFLHSCNQIHRDVKPGTYHHPV